MNSRLPNGRHATVQVKAGAVDVEFVPIPPEWPAGLERLEIRLDGVPVGEVDFRACTACQLAIVEHVRIDPPYRRRRLARQAVRLLLAGYPAHRWHTTAIQPEATGFWEALGWPSATGGEPAWCGHMYEADRHTS